MARFLPIACLCTLAIGAASAQVRIHDPAVRLLAKPFGIEKRIQLESIDGIHCAKDGSKRIAFTLRNSGVKEVVLKNPVFSLDIVLPDGSWASLGSISGASITFPITGKTKEARRSYVAELTSNLKRADLEGYLRQAAKTSARVRLLGKAEMNVNNRGKTEFSKKNLKLEVGATTTLGKSFKAVDVTRSSELPTTGLKSH